MSLREAAVRALALLEAHEVCSDENWVPFCDYCQKRSKAKSFVHKDDCEWVATVKALREELRETQKTLPATPLIPTSRAEEMVEAEREEIIQAVGGLDLMQWVKTRVAQAISARSKKA